MVNRSKLHSFDEEALQILYKIPHQKKSAFVRESVKLLHKVKMNQIQDTIPEKNQS